MITKTLYIIGNGFDLLHGIPSSYWNFKSYVEKYDNQLFQSLEAYFDTDELWSDFEDTLAHLDIDQIRDEAMNYLEPYSAENWSDAFHHDYQYEINQRVLLVSEKLLQHFTDWILSLKQPILTDLPLLLNKDAIFINFNYTPTLQTLYNVDDTSVLHIHNKAEDRKSKLLLGHGWKPKPKEKVQDHPNDPDDFYDDGDPRVNEGEEILNRYFRDTYKPVESVLEHNQSFFRSLKNIESIFVFGHSMSSVDLPYFKAIIVEIDKAKVMWQVSYHKESEKQERIDVLVDLGVPETNIHLHKLEHFGKDPSQSKLF